MSVNFAITGVAGYIAPRHLRAIRDTGNRLVAATDPHDSVGLLDSYAYDVAFFREFERFDRHVDRLRRGPPEGRVHWLSICSPNYLHDAHIRFALRSGAHALCEKPLVLNPWNCEALLAMEEESGRRVYSVLQLRCHPAVIGLRNRIHAQPPGTRHDVRLRYVTPRGRWYQYSWKGNPEQSGGLATNIGVHFFDMLIWVFGDVEHSEVHVAESVRTSGFLRLRRADVHWALSIAPEDAPAAPADAGRSTARTVTVDGENIDFTSGFTDLHTRVYEHALAGQGFGIHDVLPSIRLAHDIRHARPTGEPG